MYQTRLRKLSPFSQALTFSNWFPPHSPSWRCVEEPRGFHSGGNGTPTWGPALSWSGHCVWRRHRRRTPPGDETEPERQWNISHLSAPTCQPPHRLWVVHKHTVSHIPIYSTDTAGNAFVFVFLEFKSRLSCVAPVMHVLKLRGSQRCVWWWNWTPLISDWPPRVPP